MKKITWIISLIIISIILIIFSLYSVSEGSWIWEDGTTWQRILGTLSGIAAFTGVAATLLFWKRKTHAYIFAVANSLLFGLFALSINLTADFIVNLLWILPSLLVTFLLNKKEKMTERRITLRSAFVYTTLFVLSFVLFLFITPHINQRWSKVANINNFGYGLHFKYYWAGRILDTLMNSITFIGIIMMIKGYKEVWYLWIIKNIVAICFFSGVAVINISIIIMNVIYLFMVSFIIFQNQKSKTLRVAIIGPGAVGKTTVIKNLKPFLEENNMPLFDEREGIITDDFSDYMADMKTHAYKMQNAFFEKRIEQFKKMCSKPKGLMDRHSTDDFIFSELHIQEGNFNDEESKKWKNKDFKRYWQQLKSLPKLDIVFILMGSDEMIESRREDRSSSNEIRKHEISNKEFFRKANQMYHDENSVMYKAFEFSKEQIFIENVDSNATSEKIKGILTSKM